MLRLNFIVDRQSPCMAAMITTNGLYRHRYAEAALSRAGCTYACFMQYWNKKTDVERAEDKMCKVLVESYF